MIPQPNLLFLELHPPPLLPIQTPTYISVPFIFSLPSPTFCSFLLCMLHTLAPYVVHSASPPQYTFSHVLLCALSPALFLNPSDPARVLKNVLSSLSNHNSNLFSYFLLYFSSVLLFLMFHHLLRLSPIPFSYCCLYFHLQSP